MESPNINLRTNRIKNAISEILTEICEEAPPESIENLRKLFSSKINLAPSFKVFISKKVPSLSIGKYLERLLKYSNAEESTLILILIYIDRLCEITKLSLSFYSIHK